MPSDLSSSRNFTHTSDAAASSSQMTKVSHAVTNVGWTAEEVDALNTLPQRYRHLFPEGFESAPPLKLKKRAVAIAGTKLQRLRDVLYGAEKDFIVNEFHARAMYPHVRLDDNLREAYGGMLEEAPLVAVRSSITGRWLPCTRTRSVEHRAETTGCWSTQMSKWFAEQKRSRLEKFQAEQLLKVGPARMEQERLKLKKRIQRYMGELEFPHNKYEDLEKTRIVFRALDAYYSRRHGTNEKFMALVSAGYSNPIEVVAHFWLGESIEVRNALFAKCVLHSADVFGNDPQRLHEWVRAFETTEAFNDFFGVKRGEDRKRRAVSD